MGTSGSLKVGLEAFPVRFQPPDEVNLVGHFLKGLVERGIVAGGERLRRRLLGSRFLIRSEGMEVTLIFEESAVEIRRGSWPRIDATVEAEMAPLLGVLRGEGMISAWFEGRVSVRGKMWRFLPLVRLLRAGLAGKGEGEVGR